MALPALFLPLNAIRNLLSAKQGEALIMPLLAIAFLFAMVWDDLETSFSAAIASIYADTNAGAVVLSFTHAGSGEKRLIVKINDVGPLKSGRVLDLNERSMRYFDPFLVQGLIQDVKITLWPGEDWSTGPVGDVYEIDFDAARWPRHDGFANEDVELANMRARLAPAAEPDMKADARVEVRLSGG